MIAIFKVHVKNEINITLLPTTKMLMPLTVTIINLRVSLLDAHR